MTEVSCATCVILMHTYKISIAETACLDLSQKLNQHQTVVLAETNSDNCYFIIPANDSEILLDLASEFRRPVERITISDLRKRYSNARYRTLLGDSKLVETLFQ